MNPSLRTIASSCRSLAGGLADLLLPGVCPGCDAAPVEVGGLCSRCNVKLLSLVALPYCPRCGSTLGPNIPAYEDGCAACPSTLPRFRQVVRLGPYAAPLRGIVRGLKYWRGGLLAARAGELLAEAAANRLDQTQWGLVLPVPMHWRRRLARPADHARILARSLARAMQLPLGDELIRVRHTPPQVHLSRTRRIENVRGAFAIRKGGDITGANVILVDDVTTTGATANEAARTVLAGGASAVALAVIAKAEPPTAYARHWA